MNITNSTDILSQIEDFANKKTKKAWLTKHINQQADYVHELHTKFFVKKWKHYFGEPLNEAVIENEAAQLDELIKARCVLTKEQPSDIYALLKQRYETNEVEQPKKAEKVVKSEAPKPTASETALAELTKSMTNLTSQLTELTKIVVKNSVDIAAVQKQVSELAKKPETPRVAKATASSTAKVVEDKPKKTSTSVLTELFGYFKPVKPEPTKTTKTAKATKRDRKEYNPYGSNRKASKMAWLEVR